MTDEAAPRAPVDPIERIGRLFTTLNPLLDRLQSGPDRSLELAAFDLHEHLTARATFERSASGPGALLQLAILNALALDLAHLAEQTAEVEAQRLSRSCNRLAHSLADWMEATLGVTRESMGADYFLSAGSNPSVKLAQEMA